MKKWRWAAILAIALIIEACLAAAALTIHSAGYAIRYQPMTATPVPQSPPGTEKRALAILTRTMDSVSKVESGFCPTEFDALRQWVKTHGVLCGCMADLYHGYLDRAGIPNRVVNFAAGLGAPADTHATVEVALNGKWVILDPTFHVRFWHDGQPLGARDLMNLYYRHETNQILAQFLGDVTYPARIEKYYIDYRLLPQHVYYVVGNGIGLGFSSASAHKLLRPLVEPLMFFYRTSYYILPDNAALAGQMQILYQNATRLDFIAAVAIPIAMLVVLIGTGIAAGLMLRRRVE